MGWGRKIESTGPRSGLFRGKPGAATTALKTTGIGMGVLQEGVPTRAVGTTEAIQRPTQRANTREPLLLKEPDVVDV